MWTVTAIAAGVLMLSSGGSPLDSTLGLAETRHAPPDLRRTTPDQAKPFLGEWMSLVEGPSGPVTFLIQVKVAEGTVVATVSSELMGPNTVQDVSNTENGISLRYTGELSGYSANAVVILTPHGINFRWISGGRCEFSGIATKKPSAKLAWTHSLRMLKVTS
jgi:hypothetical protein